VLNLGISSRPKTNSGEALSSSVSLACGNFDCESWSFGHDKLDRQSYSWNVLASRSLSLPMEVKHFESILATVVVFVVVFRILKRRNCARTKNYGSVECSLLLLAHNVSACKSSLSLSLSLSLRLFLLLSLYFLFECDGCCKNLKTILTIL